MSAKKKLPKSVTTVCVGNICRSPVAEVLLRDYTRKSKNTALHHINFDSAGLFGGKLQISDISCEFVKEKGLTLTGFRSKMTTKRYLAQYDQILVMEHWHKEYILKHYFNNSSKRKRRQIAAKVKTLSEAAGIEGDIIDPFTIETEKFRKILTIIDYSCQKIVSQWEQVSAEL